MALVRRNKIPFGAAEQLRKKPRHPLATIVCPEETSNRLEGHQEVPNVTITDLLEEDPAVVRYLSKALGNPEIDFFGNSSPEIGVRFRCLLERLSTHTNLLPEENAIMTTAQIVVLRRIARQK